MLLLLVAGGCSLAAAAVLHAAPPSLHCCISPRQLHVCRLASLVLLKQGQPLLRC
jgi:hypothetical protein